MKLKPYVLMASAAFPVIAVKASDELPKTVLAERGNCVARLVELTCSVAAANQSQRPAK
jgi:hypothetical protein